MRTRTLASLDSHMPVEIGDVIHPPGAGYSGKVVVLDPKLNEIKLGVPADAPQGCMVTSIDACGIVWMDEHYIEPRPPGEVDHGPASKR